MADEIKTSFPDMLETQKIFNKNIIRPLLDLHMKELKKMKKQELMTVPLTEDLVAPFGVEFTGQPFLTEAKTFIACPVCNAAITASGTGWFDSYCETKFPNSEATGVYVCKEHLSQQRKDEINGKRSSDKPVNFESEKEWVMSEQNLVQKPGPLESMVASISKHVHDKDLMDGVEKLIKLHEVR